ncbi:hypothetical protein BCT54_24375 [Vibrio splendidus]|uniref:Uncharacterized protein n=1 Tax=Vibrio splendidus TaxID=29497 RepID=A0A2N7JQ18_VIBSP|nr:hypothetical protein BCT54_24375 [Vibrio splendidus]
MLQQYIDTFLVECNASKEIGKRAVTTKTSLNIVVNLIAVVAFYVQSSNPLILNSLQIVQCRFAKSGACDAQE